MRRCNLLCCGENSVACMNERSCPRGGEYGRSQMIMLLCSNFVPYINDSVDFCDADESDVHAFVEECTCHVIFVEECTCHVICYLSFIKSLIKTYIRKHGK